MLAVSSAQLASWPDKVCSLDIRFLRLSSLIQSVKLSKEILTSIGSLPQSTAQEAARADICNCKSQGHGKEPGPTTLLVVLACSLLGEGATFSSSIIIAN
ncbi:hypothetical protein J0S82_015222, partial [Galemys pyrenaicus]